MNSIKTALAALVLLTATVHVSAQITKVNRTYGTPIWAPKAPATVKYYYLPDINTYYDVPARRYIYRENGAWVRTTTLPTYNKGYDLRTSRPVYLTDYRGNTPYMLYKEHKVKFKGRGWKPNGHDNGLHRGQVKKFHKGYDKDHDMKHDKDRDDDQNQGHEKSKGKGKNK